MKTKERNLRKAADALLTAITEATAAGFVVEWPRDAAGLSAMAISETAKAEEDEEAAPGVPT